MSSIFDSIRQINEHGQEYWLARELAKILEYKDFENFENVIEKAQESCKNTKQKLGDHFGDVIEMVEIASGTQRELPSFRLSRYACYLIAQNSDPRKLTIIQAQMYFAVQAQKKESKILHPSLTSLIQRSNLDISIVDSKKLLNGTRIDAEHYQFEYLDFREKFNHLHTKRVGDLMERGVTTGHTPSMKEEKYYGGNIAFIKTDNLREDEIKGEFSHYLSDKGNKILAKSSLKEGDILVTIIGATYDIVGRTAMIGKENLPANINQNIALIRLDKDKVNNYYINVFFNSKYGRLSLHSMARQTEQVNLNCTEIENIILPLPSPIFQSHIAELVQEAHIQREFSKSFYAEAEQILLKELGLIDWNPTEISITEKMSEEVRLFGRCDAEFFQPKYDELFERLSKFQTQKLGDIVDYQKGVEPGADAYSETGIPFIRVADVNIDGIDSIEKNISPELLEEYGERYSPKKDEILFTKDGTIGISFVVNEDMRAVLSGAFLRLQKKIDIESEYLALVLNSVVSKMQIERFSGGAIIAHLKPSDAMEILIPILSPDIQSLMSSRIIASHSAREQSKTLLERAKRAVEIFIEEDEESAERFLIS